MSAPHTPGQATPAGHVAATEYDEPTVAIFVGDHVTAIGRDHSTGLPRAGSAAIPFPIPFTPAPKKD